MAITQSCPLNLRIEVLSYLPLRDLFQSLLPTSRLLYTTLQSSECLKELLKVHIHLSLPTQMAWKDLLQVLLTNAPSVKPARKLLGITGWGVSGGDDELIQSVWKPAYLFSKDSQGYSSGGHGNLVCAGFLDAVNVELGAEIKQKALNANQLLSCPRVDLVQEVQVEGIGRFLGCIHQIYLSRRGIFSCPLKTFILLTSLEKVSVCSPDFETYFDLLTAQDVFDRFRLQISHHSSSHKYETLHFRPFSSSNSLNPVLWGQFQSKRCTTIKETLPSRYLARYFYLLLIDSDNRMQEFQDFHSQPNVDLHSLQLAGRVIRLY